MIRKRGARGFTLIELLIVVVIIGILATIAIPKFASTKEQAFLAAMKTDLRNLATAEESYMYEYCGLHDESVELLYDDDRASWARASRLPQTAGPGSLDTT